jgi:hypothetical protein
MVGITLQPPCSWRNNFRYMLDRRWDTHFICRLCICRWSMTKLLFVGAWSSHIGCSGSYARAAAVIAVQYWLEISFRHSVVNFNGALLNFVLLVRLIGPSHLSFSNSASVLRPFVVRCRLNVIHCEWMLSATLLCLMLLSLAWTVGMLCLL